MVPTYFDNVFSYSGNNRGLQGFLDAIVLIMETGFCVTAFVCMILNLTLDEELEETDEKLVAANEPVVIKDTIGGDIHGSDSSRIVGSHEKQV